MSDPHLDELVRQAATATGATPQATSSIINWLVDGDHMRRTGKVLRRPRQQPSPISYAGDGSPVFAKGADFASHETIEMPGKKGV